jgi:predicted metal-binding protein
MDKFNRLYNVISHNNDVALVKVINPNQLIVTQKVRDYCIENKCGKYNKNFMCPPYTGDINSFKERLKNYRKGIIIGVKDKILKDDRKEKAYESADKLHKIMLDAELMAKKLGFDNGTALIGGNCRICRVCAVELGLKNCLYPEKARPSLEAMGIDVIETLRNIGITLEFRQDEVTWIGLLLI